MIKSRYLSTILLLTGLGLAGAPVKAQQTTTASELQLVNTPVIDKTIETNTTETSAKPAPELPDYRLVLKLKERKVYVFQGDKQVAAYPVAVGKKGWETPTGNFQVLQKVPNPIWQNPWNGTIVPAGPKNPLGERWIGFWTDGKNSIGFHGTAGEHLIGQAVSHGCVRMRNKDIKAMFEKVKVGTPVIVVP